MTIRGSVCRSILPCLLLTVGTSLLGTGASLARDLTFEERVTAQEAIERVYYSHQIGATKPFEEAVPRKVLEKKVRTYLKESAALASFWSRPITAQVLQGELARIARESHFPDRLQEIYLALDNDPFLVQECFIRAELAEGLSRNLSSRDGRIHAEARQQAEVLRQRLVTGELSIFADHPARSVARIMLAPSSRLPAPSLLES